MQWKTTNSNERLLNAVESAGIPTDGKTRNPGEEKEELHGKAIAFTVYWENRRSEETGTGYRQDCWKKKLMDANICTMQDQALRTNSIKSKDDKQSVCVSPPFRLSGERWNEENISHVVAEWKMFAQKQCSFGNV